MSKSMIRAQLRPCFNILRRTHPVVGILLVSILATQWGTEVHDGGKTVWFRDRRQHRGARSTDPTGSGRILRTTRTSSRRTGRSRSRKTAVNGLSDAGGLLARSGTLT